MSLEINASEERGIDIIRNRIVPFANSNQTFTWGEVTGNIKLVILDEADSMTIDAQLALKNVIDAYSKSTRFCLICNCIKKIHYSIVSRCVKFRTHPIPKTLIFDRVKIICEIEKINMTTDAIKKIISHCHGDMRRVINILQSISSAHNNIDSTCVSKFLNDVTNNIVTEIFETLIMDDIKTSTNKILAMLQYSGYSIGELFSRANSKLIKNFIDKKPICKKYELDSNQLRDLIVGIGESECLLYSNVNINVIVSNLSCIFNYVVKQKR